MALRTVITGTGSYIPENIRTNADFASQVFYDERERLLELPPETVARKFKEITGISERRYVGPDLDTTTLAVLASRMAIRNSGVDAESIDQIIFAHNFGNILPNTIQTDLLPSLASRVRHHLGIKSAGCVPYDLIFGCAGWIQGMIQADAFMKAGIAKKCLVIGAETLSRVVDIYDRDSMIFSDGAGACVVEAITGTAKSSGILASANQSHTDKEAWYLHLGKSNKPGSDPAVRYLKMKGRKVYEYAMRYVPQAMKNCLDKSGVAIGDVKKFFLHQANEKMDEGFIKALYELYEIRDIPEHIMPMSIHQLGNSSVATIPTLYHLVRTGALGDHQLHPGDIVMFASVGAGMNINALLYRF